MRLNSSGGERESMEVSLLTTETSSGNTHFVREIIQNVRLLFQAKCCASGILPKHCARF